MQKFAITIGFVLAIVGGLPSRVISGSAAEEPVAQERIEKREARTRKLLNPDYIYKKQHAKYARALSAYRGTIYDTVFVKPLSPIPHYCRPRKEGTPALYVLAREELLLVRRSNKSVPFSRWFDVDGFVLIDANGNGTPEAYGFGSERSSFGGGYDTIHSIEGPEFTDELKRNFARGLTIVPYAPRTAFINMADWICHPTHNAHGEIGAN